MKRWLVRNWDRSLWVWWRKWNKAAVWRRNQHSNPSAEGRGWSNTKSLKLTFVRYLLFSPSEPRQNYSIPYGCVKCWAFQCYLTFCSPEVRQITSQIYDQSFAPRKLGGFLMRKTQFDEKKNSFESIAKESLWCWIPIDVQVKVFRLKSYLQMWLLFQCPLFNLYAKKRS